MSLNYLLWGYTISPLNQNIKTHFHLKVTETLFGNSAFLGAPSKLCEGRRKNKQSTPGIKNKIKNSLPSKLSIKNTKEESSTQEDSVYL